MSYINVDGTRLFVSHTVIAALEEELAYLVKYCPEEATGEIRKKLAAAKGHFYRDAINNLLATIIHNLDEKRNLLRRVEKRVIADTNYDTLSNEISALVLKVRGDEIENAIELLQSYTTKDKEE